MSISPLGAASGVSGGAYNFTNVTNAQFLQEIRNLGQQGKLSGQEQMLATLDAEGGDSVPISGPATAQALSDQTLRNVITQFQGIDYNAHRPGSVGAAPYDSLLQKLQTYQGTPIGGSGASTVA